MTSAHLTRLDTAAVSEDAFVFAYPLVLMELTRIDMTSVPAPDPNTMRAPLNRLVHARGRLGADTLMSSAWLDLAEGPVVLSVPDTHGRYYVMSTDRPVDERVRLDRSAHDGHGCRRVRDRAGHGARRAAARGRDADRRSHPLRADRRPDVRRPRRVGADAIERGLRPRATQPPAGRARGNRDRGRRGRPRARPHSGSTGWMPRRSSGSQAGCSRTTRHASRTAA